MKKKLLEYRFTRFYSLLVLSLLLAISSNVSATHFTASSSTQDSITVSIESYNSCFWIAGGYSDFHIKKNGVDVEVKRIGTSLSDRYPNLYNYEIDCSDEAANSTVKISVQVYHHDAFTYGYWESSPIDKSITLSSYTPVSNVKATVNTKQQVDITWDVNELFNTHSYMVLRDGVGISPELPAGTKSYTDTSSEPGKSYTYKIKSLSNGNVQYSAEVRGTSFDTDFSASDNVDNVDFSWNSIEETLDAEGFVIEYLKPETDDYSLLYAENYIGSSWSTSSVENEKLIPGYLYDFKFMVTPSSKSDIIGYTTGKRIANGTISGRVATPVTPNSPKGIGVPNTKIQVTLLGETLPSDTTRVYTTVTDANGDYELNHIYYYEEADFKVEPLNKSDNSALELNGIDQTIEVNNTVIPDTGDFTVEVWAKNNHIFGTQEILSQSNSSAIGEEFYIGHDYLGKIRCGDSWVTSSVNYPTDGAWHHFALTKNQDSTYLYLDGECVDSVAYAIKNPAGEQFFIGRQYEPYLEYFNGSIDEVRIWNTARTSQEIKTHYGDVMTGSESGLVALYTCDKIEDNKLPNATSDSLYGTLNNDPQLTVFASPRKFESNTSYSPDSLVVTLDIIAPTAVADFANTSSYIISGSVVQNTNDGPCPVSNVGMYLDGIEQNIYTDSAGVFNIPVMQGGEYVVTPVLDALLFNPSNITVQVNSDVEDVDFVDTTLFLVEGYLTASCLQYMGYGDIQFTDNACACFDTTISTSQTDGYFSVYLPAREYLIEVTDFMTFDDEVVSSIDVLAYFSTPRYLELRRDSSFVNGDTLSYDLCYHDKVELNMDGIYKHTACEDYNSVPIVQQFTTYDLQLNAQEVFNGVSCSADSGYILFSENVTSNNMDINKSTFCFTMGDTVHINFTPGTPNITPNYMKQIEAILFIDGQARDTIKQDVIVEGTRPREQTFTTVSPSVPMLVLHDPPGDASYSFLEENYTSSHSFSASFLKELGVEAYVTAQLGKTVSVGEGVSAEVDQKVDLTVTIAGGASDYHDSTTTITLSTTNGYSTSEDESVIGNSGDVYIGAAFNMFYATGDVLNYIDDSCLIRIGKTLAMSPDKIATTYMHTEAYITDFLIPDLLSTADNYTQQNILDSAQHFIDQAENWQEMVKVNTENRDAATYFDNKTFNGGVPFENTVENSTTKSTYYEYNWYLEASVAADLGMSVAGQGLYGGVKVKGRLEWGGTESDDNTTSSKVGYYLHDDEVGDNYTVDICTDEVYNTPVFKLLAAETSCPWEEGTLPRDGVQLSADTYSQSVEENEVAVFILSLSNLTQSDEARTYGLVFDHENNIGGAEIKVSGSPVVGGIATPYTIDALDTKEVTVTVTKGPLVSTYNDLKFTLKSTCDDNISTDVYLDVEFYKAFDLNISAEGLGVVNYPYGITGVKQFEALNLYASPEKGYVFDKWVVDGITYERQGVQLNVNDNIDAKVYFIATTLPQSELEVLSFGPGSTMPTLGTHVVYTDSLFTFTALPDENCIFQKWVIDGMVFDDAQATVAITRNTKAYAYFADTSKVSYDLTISQEGNGIITPEAGTYAIDSGNSITLIATPDAGHVFDNWEINGSQIMDSIVSIVIIEGTTAKATFTPVNAIATHEISAINLYPNPSSGLVKFDSDQAISSVTVYDVVGARVFEDSDVNATAYNADLKHLNAGVYVVLVQAGNIISKHKLNIIKE